MTLLTRIARLFKADLHGILDSLEEPEIILKQAIREMEEEIERNQSQLKHLETNAERLTALGAESANRLDELDTQIDLCFEQANETLVRTLIRRKLETVERLKMLKSRREALEAERTLVRTRLSERREKLEAIIEKQQLFADTKGYEVDDAPDAEWGSGGRARISEEEIDVAFLQEKKRRAQQGGADRQAEA